MSPISEDYRLRFANLQKVARNLESLVSDHLREKSCIDRITARAKNPDSFDKKAARLDDKGRAVYRDPLTEIQDQLGARVVVFYLATVDAVSNELSRYFQQIEAGVHVPESNWEFGYFGYHSVVALPHDVIPSGVPVDDVPRFFELQIKTLFQHAWSEAEHDLGYKADGPLSPDHERRFAFAAAQGWGADRIFEELRVELAG